jgi:hypothetical protein
MNTCIRHSKILYIWQSPKGVIVYECKVGADNKKGGKAK